MIYYEICHRNGLYEIWKWTGDYHAERIKSFKTRNGAENWARKQWARVIWKA